MEISERILSEASQLFMKHGIRSVTMDDIAKEMGISKRTIYENFRDKDELLKNCILKNREEQKLQIHGLVATSSNVIDAIFRVMVEVTATMNKIHPSFIIDLRKYHYQIWKNFVMQHQADHIRELGRLIQKGVEDGIFRQDIIVDIVTRMLNLQLRELSNEEVFPPDLYSRAEVFVNIIVNFTRGIATEKGIRIIEQILDEQRQKGTIK